MTGTNPPSIPAPPKARHHLRRSLALFNWSGGLRNVFDTVCGSNTFVFVSFVLAVGLAKEKMGFITAVASVACVVQVLGLLLVNRARDQKAFILAVAVVEPVLLIACVLGLPFLPAGARLAVLILTVFLSATAFNLVRPLLESWVASSVPMGIRGRYIGKRLQSIGAAGIVALLVAGFIADRISNTNLLGLGCLLAAGAVFGLLSVVALQEAVMPQLSARSHVRWQDVHAALRTRGFRRFLLGTVLYNLPFFLAVPYYQVFNLTVAHLKQSQIAWLTVGYLLVKLLVVHRLGRHVERLGVKTLLLTTGPLWVLFFAGFACCTPDRVWPLFLGWALAGPGEAAYGVSLQSALYAVAPNTPARPVYFAITNLVSLASGALGALLAIPLLQSMQHWSFTVGPLSFGQFQCFFLLCTAMMVPAVFSARLFQVGR